MKFLYTVCILFAGASIANGQQKIIALTGKVKYYNSQTKACFFVDPEMVKAGVAKALGNKAGNTCFDQKFGKGAPINFNKLNPKSDYPKPPTENVLIAVNGYWKLTVSDKKEKEYEFIVTRWEPFF